jgi:hypothetical protein
MREHLPDRGGERDVDGIGRVQDGVARHHAFGADGPQLAERVAAWSQVCLMTVERCMGEGGCAWRPESS